MRQWIVEARPMETLYRFTSKREGRWGTDILVLSLAFSFSLFLFLGTFPLMDPDEGRYAEIPREMLASGDFVTPHLCGMKFFFKPPLFYWMNAASMALLGESEFAVRFPAALCGLLTVLLVYYTGRRMFGRRVGMLSALILGTSAGYFVCARLCIIDMPLALFMTAALSFWIIASIARGARRTILLHLFWASLGLATLAKGPIGFLLPCAVIAAYALIARKRRLLAEMRWSTGLPLFLLISAPWFALVSWRNPEFARFFFYREHIARFLTTVHRREEPFGFFVPIILLLLFPWSLFLPAVVRQLWRERGRGGERIPLFLFLWAAIVFTFFSLSRSALITYIIPVLPPVALLMGAAFSRLFDGISRSWIWQARAVSAVLCAAGVFGMFYSFVYHIRGLSHPGFIAMGTLILAGGVFSWTRIRRGNAAGFFCALLVTIYLTDIVASRLIPRVFMATRTCRRLALIANRRLGPDTVLASYLYAPSLAFYTHRPFVMVDAPDTIDFEFGSDIPGEPDLFLDIGRFIRTWDSGRHVIALMKRRDARYLGEKARVPVTVIGRIGEQVLVENRGSPRE
jgi:4-amino-4-deoxy-L-arabinose transferase-like glycosyltransferase